MDTNWGEVCDDRINDNLDFSEIHSQKDFEKAVRKFLRDTPDKYGNYRGRNILNAVKRTPDDIIDEMYKESSAEDKVEDKKLEEAEEEKKALRKAQRLHAKRPRRGRLADERITAKDTRRATRRTVRVWRRRRYKGIDIKFIDTMKRMKLTPKNFITKGDIRLKNIRVGLDKLSRKHYRSPITGRFVRNPFRKR